MLCEHGFLASGTGCMELLSTDMKNPVNRAGFSPVYFEFEMSVRHSFMGYMLNIKSLSITWHNYFCETREYIAT